MNSDLVILVPMLGRPHRVAPLLDSVQSTTPGARVMFLLSTNDDQVSSEVSRVGAEWIDIPYHPVGDYARKINTGYRETTEPLIFMAADDLKFHPGWIEAARKHLTEGVGVVGTNDLGNPRVTSGVHSTHSLVTRWYVDRCGLIDRPRAVLYEGYPHEYIDDELVETAKHRGMFAMALDAHVEHLHPNWGKAPLDPLYRQQQNRMVRGRNLYLTRRRLWT